MVCITAVPILTAVDIINIINPINLPINPHFAIFFILSLSFFKEMNKLEMSVEDTIHAILYDRNASSKTAEKAA